MQDINDLFGADLPVEGGKGVNFAWRDGPLLRALKNGDWVLLDEVRVTVNCNMNLVTAGPSLVSFVVLYSTWLFLISFYRLLTPICYLASAAHFRLYCYNYNLLNAAGV